MPDDRTTARSQRPTAWIAMTIVLAAVAVGLGIWALSAQSDADDAQAKLDAQQRVGATTAEPIEIDPETRQRYEELKTQLEIAGGDIAGQLEEAVANSATAEQARTAADNAVDRATAEVEALKARAAVAQTCVRGALGALDAAFSAGGHEAAVAELEKISGGCRPSAS